MQILFQVEDIMKFVRLSDKQNILGRIGVSNLADTFLIQSLVADNSRSLRTGARTALQLGAKAALSWGPGQPSVAGQDGPELGVKDLRNVLNSIVAVKTRLGGPH